MHAGDTVAPGSLFGGDYRILRPLSAGGMGAVYVALQVSTARERALKIMLRELVGNDNLKRRFEQEAKIGAQIESEHVVEVLGAGVDAASGAPWLAMELLQGRDFAAYLASRGPLPTPLVLEVFEQLAHAVGAAHRKHIVHRDLKPENLFLAQTRRTGASFILKVLDFGIAKLVGQARTSATGAMGSPLWMAPEQTQTGARITPATDVWALGLIAFRAITGKVFWRSAGHADVSPMMILREMALEDIPRASERAKELGGAPVPAGFDAWFARCVDREPSRRFADADAMLDELQRVLGESADAPPAAVRSSGAALDLGASSGLSVTECAAPLSAEHDVRSSSTTVAAEPLVDEAASAEAPQSEEPEAPEEFAEPAEAPESVEPAEAADAVSSRPGAHAVSSPGSQPAESPIDAGLTIPTQRPPVALFAGGALVLAGGLLAIAWVAASGGNQPSGGTGPLTSVQPSAQALGYDELVKESLRLANEGKLDAAFKLAERARELDAARPGALYAAAFVHSEQCFKAPSGSFALPCADCDGPRCEACVRESTKVIERGGFRHDELLRGRCLAGLGRSTEALASFDQAIVKNPRDADYHEHRALLLLSIGRRQEACRGAATALELGATELHSSLSSACGNAAP